MRENGQSHVYIQNHGVVASQLADDTEVALIAGDVVGESVGPAVDDKLSDSVGVDKLGDSVGVVVGPAVGS